MCYALASRFAASNCSGLASISWHDTSWVMWPVMDFLMMSEILFKNVLILTASVIDLRPCLWISLLYMSSNARSMGKTLICWPYLSGVIVFHAFHRRALLMDGIRDFRRASMNLLNAWSFSCSSPRNWLASTSEQLVTWQGMNSKSLVLFRSISLYAKNLHNAFTHPPNLCEFFHLLSLPSRVSGGSSLIHIRALLFFIVILGATTALTDCYSCAATDFWSSKFLLAAYRGIVV